MEIKEIKLRELKPSKGMALTNGETYSAPDTPIYLGVNDSPDNWHEITREEYNKSLEETAKEEKNDV